MSRGGRRRRAEGVWAGGGCPGEGARGGRRSRSTAWRWRSAWTLLSQSFADRRGKRFGRMRPRDAELALEDEGRHRRDAEPAHALLVLGNACSVRLTGPA